MLAAARAVGTPLLDGVMPMPLPAWNGAFDPLYPPGDQWYWRGDFVNEITDAAIDIARRVRAEAADVAVDDAPLSDRRRGRAGRCPTRRRGPTATRMDGVFVGVDPDPANADADQGLDGRYWEALHPYSMGGAYVNFMMDEGQERVQATYGDELRAPRRDQGEVRPGNLFHVNQNIRPAS